MLYFAIALKYLRRARLIYRITDFYPEAIIAHLGRSTPPLALLERFTWFLRKKVDRFEVLGEDQRALLLRGGIPQERIAIKRDTTPVLVTGRETPAPKPPALGDRKVLLYSGNYGVAHEVETVAQGLTRHHQVGTRQFALWLNATGENADILERRLLEQRVPVARTAPVDLKDFPALLVAADAHLITLRSEFAGIVFPSKVYACILSGRPIYFCWPEKLRRPFVVHPSAAALHPRYASRCGWFCAGLGRAKRKLNFRERIAVRWFLDVVASAVDLQ